MNRQDLEDLKRQFAELVGFNVEEQRNKWSWARPMLYELTLYALNARSQGLGDELRNVEMDSVDAHALPSPRVLGGSKPNVAHSRRA